MTDRLLHNADWMFSNLCLASVPLLFAILLTRSSSRRSRLWYFGLLVFILFLPNAPYVVSDYVHFLHDYVFLTVARESSNAIRLVFLQYVVFSLIGLALYSLCMQHFVRFLPARSRLSGILIIHLACSFAIYLGRFKRLNSWDFFVRPGSLIRPFLSLDLWPYVYVTIVLLILTVSYPVVSFTTLLVLKRMPRLARLLLPPEQPETDLAHGKSG